MNRQIIQVQGTYNPTLDFGVILCNTTNFPTNITLPNIESSTADKIGYQVVIQDEADNASNNLITIYASNGELINGKSSIQINVNGGALKLEPFANKYWVAYPVGTGAGGQGLLEVPVTFLQVGTNYFAKMGAIVPLIGDASSFSIVPVGGGSDQLSSNAKVISRVSINYYLQTISQAGGARAFGSLFGGVRNTGGACSPALGVNNFRMALPLELGYVPVNGIITSNVNWSGAGTLTLNGATLLVEFNQ
jgi:hypothetical protein